MNHVNFVMFSLNLVAGKILLPTITIRRRHLVKNAMTAPICHRLQLTQLRDHLRTLTQMILRNQDLVISLEKTVMNAIKFHQIRLKSLSGIIVQKILIFASPAISTMATKNTRAIH